jgi:hypothetical protein
MAQRMSTSSDEKKEPAGFWEAFQQGYDEQDEKIRKDTAPILEKTYEGLIVGALACVVNPIKWFGGFFK